MDENHSEVASKIENEVQTQESTQAKESVPTEESTQEAKESTATQVATPTSSGKNKLAEASELIEVSENLVAKAKADIEECKVGISQAAETFDEKKRAFTNVTFKNSEALLEKVGFDYTSFAEDEDFELNINPNADERFSVKTLSSGRFTGLILAILVALGTVGGWIYLAMSKLNIDPSTLSLETASSHVEPVLSWIGGDLISSESNMTVGALILGFSALIMAWLVYAIRISLKGNKNLRLAKDTFVESNEYCSTQEACKKEMQKVDAHLRDTIVEIDNLKTALNEQSSILERIIHVEGAYEEDKEYHPSSKKVMRETEKIMRGAEQLLATAITTEGQLNFKSVQALNLAKGIYDEYLSRIYD